MNIKINKQNTRLPKYFCNTKHLLVYVYLNKEYRFHSDTPSLIKKIQSATYTFNGIRELHQTSNAYNFFVIEDRYTEKFSWEHFPKNVIWQFKLKKSVHVCKHAIQYLYIY